MKRTLSSALVASIFTLLVAVGASAQVLKGSLQYAVDPTTAVPAATVVQNSQGVTVVLFRVAAIHSGDAFTFRLDLTSQSSRVTYPLAIDVGDHGNGKLEATTDPTQVVLTAAGTPGSTIVTVRVASSGDAARKLITHLKGQAERGSHVGKGPGVKVIVMQGAATGATPEQQMLQDVQDALSPDPEDAPESPRLE